MNTALGTRETMIPDIQGSIIGTLASGGALAKSGYQPYGENPAVITGAYRYTARRFDGETAGSPAEPSGLYYYRARTYSPTLGRFLQPDPIGYAGGTNLYAYVHNDPLNRTDPFGLCDNPQGCGGSSDRLLPTPATPAGNSPIAVPAPAQLASVNPIPQQGPNTLVTLPVEAVLGLPLPEPDQTSIIQIATKTPATPCTGGLCSQGGSHGSGGIFPHPLRPGQFLCEYCAKNLFDLDIKNPGDRKLLGE
jgi:RHS repeat-associated protein